MQYAAQNAQSKVPERNCLSTNLDTFDTQLDRVSEIADHLRAIADRLGGGQPRDATATPPAPEPANIVAKLSSRNETLARALSTIRDEIDRIESAL